MNRIREIRDIAVCNAEFVAAYRERAETGKEITSFRGNSFVFAAQMYGAGKTRLGREFSNQLSNCLKSSEYPLVAEPPAKLAEIKDMYQCTNVIT